LIVVNYGKITLEGFDLTSIKDIHVVDELAKESMDGCSNNSSI